MCNHCGGRAFPLVGRLSAEHRDTHGVLGGIDRSTPPRDLTTPLFPPSASA
ncbi:hypothetical protein ACL02O_06900 [Micromonospora sp. MS34]|uniref:hypothetical protein n=1 Tax=Micromonospora sp. MS34 TaxID=3385971 RepID=UPI0039A10E91